MENTLLGLYRMKKKIVPFYLILFVFFCFEIYATDNPHFYRAYFFEGEPRFERPWLTTFDASLGWGSTRTGRNAQGNKTNVLKIYGPNDMQFLGSNVDTLDPMNPLDQILINLAALPENDGFGKLNSCGKFSIVEATFNFYQNLCNGFFFQSYLPARKLRIRKITFQDLSPETGIPNINNPDWQAFLTNFNAILQQQDLSIEPLDRAGIGDFTFYAGWARNYQNTECLDYIDVDARIGILFPTGKKQNVDRVFDLPQGYDGHWGVPLKFNISIGAYEWLTLGFHLGALFLLERTKTLRVKTDERQNGFFKLTKARIDFDPGSILDLDLYFKADHFAKGLSFLGAYSYNHQKTSCLTPKNKQMVDARIINTDSLYASWNMHIIHFMVEYDFAKRLSEIAPRIGFFYNHIIGGKRIFDTNIIDLFVGFDVCWRY